MNQENIFTIKQVIWIIVKYFLSFSSAQSTALTGDVTVTKDGFTLTPSSAASSNTCTIYVKEKDSKYGYYPAICTGNKLCIQTCNLEFTITGLYSGNSYDIKVVPSRNYAVKTIENQMTSKQVYWSLIK